MIASINALSDRLPIRNTKHHLSLSPPPLNPDLETSSHLLSVGL